MDRKRTASLTSAIVLLIAMTSQLAAQSAPPADTRDLRRTPVVEVFQMHKDAVVSISATQLTTIRDRFGFFDDDLFDRMFDLPIGRRRRVRANSVGSGFVLHPDGYIVTNAHVVARTEKRTVVFGDGTELPAEIIAIDMESDLAILKVDAPSPLPTLTLGRSDDLMVGETVIAIGNPFGFQHTVTSGVVSALDRSIEIDQRLHFEGLIQTDASINPGNSGGPLLNVLGELIGVNTAIRGDAQNIGFAIPVDQLRDRLPDLLNIERRDRVSLGMKLTDREGVRIVSVTESGPAFEAGIRAEDEITAVDGIPVNNLVSYHIALLNRKAGDTIDLAIRRGGATIATSIEIRALPIPDGTALARQRLGIDVVQLDGRELAESGISGMSALRIEHLDRDSPALVAEAREGDFLLAINGHGFTTLDELGLLLDPVRSGDQISVTFARLRPGFRQQNTIPIQVN